MFDSNGLLAILLLVIGLIILVAEVFVPSGGLLAILTSITLILSLVAAYAAWFDDAPVLWWSFCSVVVFSIPVSLATAFYWLPRTPFGRKLLLEAPNPEDVEPFLRETAQLEKLIGMFGVAQSQLSPGGLVQVQGARHHAFTEGPMVDRGAAIEVLEVRGTRLLVRIARSQPETNPPSSIPSSPQVETGRLKTGAETGTPPHLDFDFPVE